MAHIQDRWHNVTTGTDGRKVRTRTARYGNGKRWRVRYTDPGGRERSQSFAREDEAKAFRATVETDLLTGSWTDPRDGQVTLRSFATGWLAGLGNEATTREKVRERVRVHILPALGDHPLGRLAQRPSIIQAWLSGLPLSDNYQRAVFSHLSAMLNAAVEDGLIRRNPCRARSVKPPRETMPRVVPWVSAQVSATRAHLPARYRAMTDAGAGVGMRQGEVFGLAVEDVEWMRGTVVHVRRQVRIVEGQLCFALPKGRRVRDVPLPLSVKERLSAHLAAFPAVPVTLPWKEPGGKPVTANLIFTTSRGTALNRAYFGQLVWKPAVLDAGLPGTREDGFHALRHYFASVLLHSGVDIRRLSAYLGHHDPGFTLRVYTHLIPDGEDSMRQAIDDLFAEPDGPATAHEG